MPYVPKQCKQANPVRFGTKLVHLTTIYCHLLFLAKTNKENDNLMITFRFRWAKFKEILVNIGLERNEATSGGQAF
jgi:hypothetical protein